MNKADIIGTWIDTKCLFFKGGKEIGSWKETGIWIFADDGHFCFSVNYLGNDSNYPKELATNLHFGGTYHLEADKLITETITSSQIKRIGKTQNYDVWMEENKLFIKGVFPDFEFISEFTRPV